MTSIEIERQAIRECGKRKQIDRDRIIRLWSGSEYWTQQDVADICRCSIGTVRHVLIQAGFMHVHKIGDYAWRQIERYKQ